MKHKTKHSDRTFKKKKKKKRKETLSKIKHKNVKAAIKNSPSVTESHLKTHKLESICYRHLVKKHHQTVNFRYKESLPRYKKTPNCKFLL